MKLYLVRAKDESVGVMFTCGVFSTKEKSEEKVNEIRLNFEKIDMQEIELTIEELVLDEITDICEHMMYD